MTGLLLLAKYSCDLFESAVQLAHVQRSIVGRQTNISGKGRVNTMRRMLAAVSVLIAIGLTTTAAFSQEEAAEQKKPPVDPTGTWKWNRTFGENELEFILKLKWDGKQLAGNYTSFNSTSEIEQAQLEEDKLSFRVERDFNGNNVVVEFDGTIEKDDIRGTIAAEFNGEAREFEWHAQRSVAPSDVAGIWLIRTEGRDGQVREREYKFTVNDQNKLRSSYVGRAGELREIEDVQLKDNELSFETSREGNNGEFKIAFKGKPRGNTMEGTIEFTFGGQTRTMEFTGKKLPEKKEESKEAAE